MEKLLLVGKFVSAVLENLLFMYTYLLFMYTYIEHKVSMC
jgi:hypothetical protein